MIQFGDDLKGQNENEYKMLIAFIDYVKFLLETIDHKEE